MFTSADGSDVSNSEGKIWAVTGLILDKKEAKIRVARIREGKWLLWKEFLKNQEKDYAHLMKGAN